MVAKSITLRLQPEISDRLDLAVARAGCTRNEWLAMATLRALEFDEARPTPAAVERAMPRMTSRGIIMPDGVSHTGMM